LENESPLKPLFPDYKVAAIAPISLFLIFVAFVFKFAMSDASLGAPTPQAAKEKVN
jgi:hypothetical protein